MDVHGKITGALSTPSRIAGSLTSAAGITGALTVPSAAFVPRYTGAYEFTPTQEAQLIEINGLMAQDDITILPIPSNYGLITWNGSTLTVS